MGEIEKNQLVFVIDYETLDTHVYNGEGKNLRIEGEIDRAKDGSKAILINVRIDLED
jgi:hypothetical protein